MQLTQRETVWLEEKSTLQHGFQGTWTSSGTREESRSIVDTKSCDARHNNFREIGYNARSIRSTNERLPLLSSSVQLKPVVRKRIRSIRIGKRQIATVIVQLGSEDERIARKGSPFFFKTVERNSRNTANQYGVHYTGSYAYSNGAPSVYSGYPTNGGFAHQPHLHEDYRPIYFYVAQPYTIPYTFAKRPRPSSLSRPGKQPRNSNCRVKFSKRLANHDFSEKVKRGEFSRSLNQVHFVENQGQVISNYPKAGLPRDPRMTSMFRRGTIFATFFLSLLGGGLVCAALVTQHWVEARPLRTLNPQVSSGRVHFGLLQGKKELNVGYGWRTYHISVPQMIKQDPTVMSWGLWISTLTTTSAALVTAGLAALLAVLNTATSPRSKILSDPGVYFVNVLTLLMCLASTSTWLAQYYTKLYLNVLLKEDIDNMWTSEGSAELGYSFWLVVCAGVVHLISIALVGWGSGRDKIERLETIPALEEKTAAAIMLY